MLSESDAQAILKKVLGFSKADEAEATLTGSAQGQPALRPQRRFHQRRRGRNLNLVVQSSFGKKTGTATINEFDDASLEKVVRRAEELARSPRKTRSMFLSSGRRSTRSRRRIFESTAGIGPDWRAKESATSIELCKAQKLEAAGFLEHDTDFTAPSPTPSGLTASSAPRAATSP